MKRYINTHSSIRPEPQRMDEYSVYICENIREEAQTNPETGETYTEFVYDMTVYGKDEYIRLLSEKNAGKLAELQAVTENSYAALVAANCTYFDGIKWVFDRDKPLDLVLPMTVVPNAFYKYGGKLYVGIGQGVVTEDNFEDMLVPDEAPEVTAYEDN